MEPEHAAQPPHNGTSAHHAPCVVGVIDEPDFAAARCWLLSPPKRLIMNPGNMPHGHGRILEGWFTLKMTDPIPRS
jgi:hypothetical protein